MAVTIFYGAEELMLDNEESRQRLAALGEDVSSINTLRCPVGASRWSTFSGYCSASQVAAIRAASPATLTIQEDVSGENVSFSNMYLSDARAVDYTGTIYHVTFVDKRYAAILIPSGLIELNVPADLTDTTYTATNTVQDVVDTLSTALGFGSLTVPAAVATQLPDAVILRWVPAARALDAFLYTFGCVLLYNVTTDTFSIELIGANVATLNSFRDDSLLIEDARQVEQVHVPESIIGVATPSPATSSSYTQSDSTGRPAGYLSGVDVAVPLGALAFGTSSVFTTSVTMSAMSTAFFSRFVGRREETYSGLKQLPIVGAIDQVWWRQRGDILSCGVQYYGGLGITRRPDWATLDQLPDNAFGGIKSRVDAFGRAQHWLDSNSSTKDKVSLTVDSSTWSGDDTTTAGYTYKWPVDVITGVEIKNSDGSRATNLVPTVQRNTGEYWSGAYGTVYRDAEGNINLWWVDEIRKVCTESDGSGLTAVSAGF